MDSTVTKICETFVIDLKDSKETFKPIDGYFWYEQFLYVYEKNSNNNILLNLIVEYRDAFLQMFLIKGNITKLISIFEPILKIKQDFSWKFACNSFICKCLMSMGKYKNALTKLNEIEAVEVEVLGEKHPAHLTTKGNIAWCLIKMGKYENALTKLNEIKLVQLEVLGEKHPDYLTTKNYIALCLMLWVNMKMH